MAEVRLSGISKSFGSTVALDDVTMTVPDGSFVVLLGPTGAGKTTLLRMVSGLTLRMPGPCRSAGIRWPDCRPLIAMSQWCSSSIPSIRT